MLNAREVRSGVRADGMGENGRRARFEEHARREAAGACVAAEPLRPRAGRVSGECAHRDSLVLDLATLVRKIALQIHRRLPSHVELDDLIGAGTLGLIEAIRRFDPSRRVDLAQYVRHRIRGAILDSLRELDPAPRDLRQQMKRFERAFVELQGRLGRPATEEEMQSALDLKSGEWAREVRGLRALAYDPMRPAAAWGASQPLDETMLEARSEDGPFVLCYRSEQRDILRRALAGLSPRDQTLMALYYRRGWTMLKIAGRLGVDESRISQLHAAACARLRSAVAAALEGPARPLPAVPERHAPAAANSNCIA